MSNFHLWNENINKMNGIDRSLHVLPIWGEIAYDEKNNLTRTGDSGRKHNLALRSNITKRGENKRGNVAMIKSTVFLDGKY